MFISGSCGNSAQVPKAIFPQMREINFTIDLDDASHYLFCYTAGRNKTSHYSPYLHFISHYHNAWHAFGQYMSVFVHKAISDDL